MDSSYSNHWSHVDLAFHDVNSLLKKSTATMPPKRITRRSVVSPSPALSDVGTPKPGKRGTLIPVEQVRNQTPTRFSLSYGSSLVAMPDRNKTAAGTDLETAFAEIHETVRTDNIKAEARRRELDARRGSTTPGPRRPDTIEEETEEEEEEEEEQEEYENQGGYYDDEEEEESEPEPPRRAAKPTQTLNKLQDQIEKTKLLEKQRAEEERAAEEKQKAEKDAAERERKRVEKEKKDKAEREKAEKAMKEKAEREKKEQAAKAQQEAKAKAAREAKERAEREAKKRARDEEAEEQAELARAERDARLRREHSEEARRQAEQKHAAEAARKKEEQRRDREAREAEMASLEEAKRQAMRPPPPPSKQLLSTPLTSKTRDLVAPDTGNSYVEESDVYTDSEKRREGLEEERRVAQQMRLYTPEPPEPPRIARRPASTLSSSLQHAQHPVNQHQELFDTEAESMSDKQYPSFGKVSKPTTARPNRTSRPLSEQSNTTNGETPPPPYTTAPTFMQRLLSLVRRSIWGVWKLFTYLLPLLLLALVVLSASSYGSPDSDSSIRWYGWKHWRSNVGQFIPGHPQLTDDQLNNLKDYILEQSSSTESAVKNIQTLLPRMVHVKRGPNGDLIIQDDFWHALLDRMLKDSSVLTLDGTGDISEEHWDAVRLRLVKAGLFEKGPSDEHILQIAEGSVSKSWERWVSKNGEKVAQIVKEHLPGDKGDGVTRDAAISRDEFVGLLKKRIAEHKEDIDDRLDAVKKGLETLIDTTVKAAISNSEGSLSKSDITTLVRNIVKKEIPRAQLEAAAKDGIMRNYHDYIETQVNHFGLGNEAGIVYTESSPVYRLESQALPGNKHLAKLLGKPKPISVKDQVSMEGEYMMALSAWSDVGQCWCAGITSSRGVQLAVEMANYVIPQAIVVEHVHPNATNDPGSMPRDIEIWGYYPDADDNKRLLAWMDELYPGEREADLKRVDDDNKKSLSLINKKYVKIGELEYDYAKTSGSHGMFVHKLSEELLDLDAATYKVLVRAKTNHGAQDHTCFYRLQLFGEELEVEDEE
ncbi:hypothetical protein B0H65DRAFT_476982 [Neurospora tetraspora]|uniref:SUN domain-containing protein n=1 Tax=Neurospora tetraspora TaxID=94610 RepID=A0AAE0J6K7_9PEZI|nr:hypothetical protein B0H65DRAFT_476982 [Neurospora tetraspora]